MIKTRLIRVVPESKKFIAVTILLQWIGLCANVILVWTIARLLDDLRQGLTENIPLTCLILGGVLVIRILCVKAAALTSYHASRSVKRTLRGMIYEKLLVLGPTYSERIPTAEVVQLAGEGVEQLETYFGQYLPQFFYALLAPVTLFVIVSRISMKVAVILLVCVPLIPAAIVAVQKIAKRLLKNYWGQYAQLGDHFLENLQGLTTLKIFQADGARHEEMNRDAEHFRIVTMKVLSMQLNSIIVMDIIAYGGAALGILLSLFEMQAGRIDFLGALVIILLSADFFLPMRRLGSFFHVAMNGMAASDKIFHLLDIEKDYEKDGIPEDSEIMIEDLHFGYSPEKEIIRGIDMTFPRGSFTALVGASGCGKSTIAAILTGRCDGYRGTVNLGGCGVDRIPDDVLMKQITLVSHNSYLFKGTVRDNLLMGRPDAPDDILWQVLKQVKMEDFLRSTDGLETLLREGGSNLSGGQRQRLVLARAILHDSPIYIFDEATSNIDVESENDIMTIIHEMARQKTVILISHRLANTVKADSIYVLDAGQAVEHGTHDSLMMRDGVYRRLWDSQQALENITKGVQA